jgi:hypothetical protein
MHRTITSGRELLRALYTVTLYILGAATLGTGLALVAEAHAAPLSQEAR